MLYQLSARSRESNSQFNRHFVDHLTLCHLSSWSQETCSRDRRDELTLKQLERLDAEVMTAATVKLPKQEGHLATSTRTQFTSADGTRASLFPFQVDTVRRLADAATQPAKEVKDESMIELPGQLRISSHPLKRSDGTMVHLYHNFITGYSTLSDRPLYLSLHMMTRNSRVLCNPPGSGQYTDTYAHTNTHTQIHTHKGPGRRVMCESFN